MSAWVRLTLEYALRTRPARGSRHVRRMSAFIVLTALQAADDERNLRIRSLPATCETGGDGRSVRDTGMRVRLQKGIRLRFGRRPRGNPSDDTGLVSEEFETGLDAQCRKVIGWRIGQAGEGYSLSWRFFAAPISPSAIARSSATISLGTIAANLSKLALLPRRKRA